MVRVQSLKLNYRVFGMVWNWLGSKVLRKIIIQTDSLVAFDLINKSEINVNDAFGIQNSIKDVMAREWTVQVKHIYREGNRVAD